ncbi:recombinase family protein [Kitasatospora sp. NPDC089797]|uniref:recombinase family protein n=1 Tax=Kitasatospora sp. NPDC089797 TaxID=3155298 RepID=UPI00342FF5B9
MQTRAAEGGARRRVVIYCRISDDREGKREGVDRQEKECRRRAERNGWDIVAVLVENDLSAYSGKPRPEYERMLQMLRSGEADAVLALSPKRLYRQIKDAFDFFDLIVQKNIEVETIKQGRFNLSTAEGRKDARRAAVDAQGESEEISERVRDSKAETLAQGEFRGGPRPFGYESNGVTLRSLICPECSAVEGFDADRRCGACGAEAANLPGSEAWHVEAATDAIIAGESLRSVCSTLAAQGVRTVARRYRQEDGSKGEPESRDWQPSELRKLLLRPRSAGLIDHYGEIIGKAGWPAIVPEDKWRACKAILEAPERRTTTTNARVWLGSGLYVCGVCGETARGSTTGVGGKAKAGEGEKTHRPAYRCRTGKHIVRDAYALDAYVEGLAVDRLSRSDAAELLLPPVAEGPSRQELAALANTLRAKLDSIAADYGQDLITRKQMLDSTAFTRARLEKITAEMVAQTSGSVLASLPLGTEEIAQQWEGYHLDKKRSIIDAIMTVTINKARRGRQPGFVPGSGTGYFDDSTIDIEWKKPR